MTCGGVPALITACTSRRGIVPSGAHREKAIRIAESFTLACSINGCDDVVCGAEKGMLANDAAVLEPFLRRAI